MKKLSTSLIICYYSTFILAILTATLGYLCQQHGWWALDAQSSVGIAIYTCIIMYVLCTTPLVLKFFGKEVDKIKLEHTNNEPELHKAYARLVVVRLAIVMVGMIASLIFCYVMNNQSLIWLAAISAVALYFCKPTKVKIEADLADEQPEETETPNE